MEVSSFKYPRSMFGPITINHARFSIGERLRVIPEMDLDGEDGNVRRMFPLVWKTVVGAQSRKIGSRSTRGGCFTCGDGSPSMVVRHRDFKGYVKSDAQESLPEVNGDCWVLRRREQRFQGTTPASKHALYAWCFCPSH